MCLDFESSARAPSQQESRSGCLKLERGARPTSRVIVRPHPLTTNYSPQVGSYFPLRPVAPARAHREAARVSTTLHAERKAASRLTQRETARGSLPNAQDRAGFLSFFFSSSPFLSPSQLGSL